MGDLFAALLFHTFIFSSSRQMCEQHPRLPLSMIPPLFFSQYTLYTLLRFIDQTHPSLVTRHMLCCFQSHFISFSDHAVRLAGRTHVQTGWKYSEGGLGWRGRFLEVITETEPAGAYVHVNLHSSPPAMSCCFLVPFTPSSL